MARPNGSISSRLAAAPSNSNGCTLSIGFRKCLQTIGLSNWATLQGQVCDALVVLRALQILHFEALLHEKAKARKILLIESLVLHRTGHRKGVVVKIAG